MSVPGPSAAARDDLDVSSKWARTALSHRICTGIGRRGLGRLIEELAPVWLAQQESRLRARRGRGRLRAEGAGPGYELPFADRVIATLVVLRFQLPHAAVAVFYGVHRSTITRAVGEIRPLLAARGFAVPGQPGLRLATLADVFAYAAAEGVKLRIDGTEVQVRRPAANRPGRRAFVSGKKKQNTIKSTVISDGRGRLLGLGAFRPGRMHDVTAVRTEGIEDLLRAHPDVTAEVDTGYQGLARDFPAQVSAPPKKPRKDAAAEDTTRWEQRRHQQSSQRICVEHAIAEPKQWRPLQRYLGRREHFAQTALAITGLVSDRAAAR
jgi:DDE superfamily endonuclease/Helix-turn-helix of DDE superfamily endonuclease